jgi:hypothetical protein
VENLELRGVPLLKLKPQQCLFVAEGNLFEFRHGEGTPHLWFDNIYMRVRYGTADPEPLFLRQFSGVLWATNITMQGDGRDITAAFDMQESADKALLQGRIPVHPTIYLLWTTGLVTCSHLRSRVMLLNVLLDMIIVLYIPSERYYINI